MNKIFEKDGHKIICGDCLEVLKELPNNSIDLIFEIIELFVDNKKLYSQCLVQMRDYYYEKIAKKFFEVNVLLHEKPNNYKEALLELQELKGRI